MRSHLTRTLKVPPENSFSQTNGKSQIAIIVVSFHFQSFSVNGLLELTPHLSSFAKQPPTSGLVKRSERCPTYDSKMFLLNIHRLSPRTTGNLCNTSWYDTDLLTSNFGHSCYKFISQGIQTGIFSKQKIPRDV